MCACVFVGMALVSSIAARWPAAAPLSAEKSPCWRRAVQAGADGAGELSEEGVEAAEAAVAAAHDACGALQRRLLDGELRTYAALGSLLGQAERQHTDAAEAGRQHFDTFFGTARPWPLAHPAQHGTLHIRCSCAMSATYIACKC